MIYSYRCPKCGEVLEREEPMKATHKANCPNCKVQCNRLFHVTTVHYNADGFTTKKKDKDVIDEIRGTV